MTQSRWNGSFVKGKSFRKAVQNYLAKIIHYSEEDCALDLLNRYLVLLQFDRDMFKCRLGVSSYFYYQNIFLLSFNEKVKSIQL
ncbi:Focal adhesion kinase 1 [Schistosoma japonicum]|nr:Focal adhesion kinase 1 [Schistosoma japonicum]